MTALSVNINKIAVLRNSRGHAEPDPVVAARIATIRAAFSRRPHIFNLGHGILPDTPIAHVEQLVAEVRR